MTNFIDDEYSGLTNRQRKVVIDYTKKMKPGVWYSVPGQCLCCKESKHGSCLYPGLCMCVCRGLSKKQRKKMMEKENEGNNEQSTTT